ncbi:MAG: hypothetical protein E6713_05740 [Sporomusaceae bacterium]|nr:hypothetical protein [Sporomusaceae bacterium]
MEEGRKVPCGCCQLSFAVVVANKPATVAANFWSQATATGEICGEKQYGHIEITANGLLPLGVYTVFFITDRGYYPAAPLDAVYTSDGFDPNRLVVNSNGIVNYYIAQFNYNPFRGIPTASGLARIQGVAINYHLDRTTYGMSPGTANVNVFDQLVAPMCLLRQDEEKEKKR